MTRLGRWVRRALERLAGVWYEGAQPPDRFGEMVVYFANTNPRATREQWVQFATELAGETFRSGYLRGFERGERDVEAQPWRQADPDALADELDPDWRWSPDITLYGPADLIPEPEEREPTAEDLLAALGDQGDRR